MIFFSCISNRRCRYNTKYFNLLFNPLFFVLIEKILYQAIALCLSLLTVSSYSWTLILLINILAYSLSGSSLLFFFVLPLLTVFGWICLHWCGTLKRHLYPMSRSCWGASDLIHESDVTWEVIDTTLIFKTNIQSHSHIYWVGINNMWLSTYMARMRSWSVYINIFTVSEHNETQSSEVHSHCKPSWLFKPELASITHF